MSGDSPKKQSGYTRLWHTHSCLPLTAYVSSIRRRLMIAWLYRLQAIVTFGLVGESRLLILAINTGASRPARTSAALRTVECR
jgi:hypothetical protein